MTGTSDSVFNCVAVGLLPGTIGTIGCVDSNDCPPPEDAIGGILVLEGWATAVVEAPPPCVIGIAVVTVVSDLAIVIGTETTNEA